MPFEKLTLGNLAAVKDGLVALMVQKALDRIAADIEQAPDIPDWRKCTLVVRAKPQLDMGHLDDVVVEFEVGAAVPKRVTSARMDVRSDSKGHRSLHYQRDALDNPRQGSLLDGQDSLADLADELRQTGRSHLADQLLDLQRQDNHDDQVEKALAASRARQAEAAAEAAPEATAEATAPQLDRKAFREMIRDQEK